MKLPKKWSLRQAASWHVRQGRELPAKRTWFMWSVFIVTWPLLSLSKRNSESAPPGVLELHMSDLSEDNIYSFAKWRRNEPVDSNIFSTNDKTNILVVQTDMQPKPKNSKGNPIPHCVLPSWSTSTRTCIGRCPADGSRYSYSDDRGCGGWEARGSW